MNTGNWITQEQPGHWRSSKLEGLNVYNNNNGSIGEIKDLLVDNSGKIEAVVIGVGGFLGLGEHHVAVPFDQIKFMNEPRAVATTAPPGRDSRRLLRLQPRLHRGLGRPRRARWRPTARLLQVRTMLAEHDEGPVEGGS